MKMAAKRGKANVCLPGNSTTTSHCVGILLSHKRLGVIKWPAAGTRRRINLEAVNDKKKAKTGVKKSFSKRQQRALQLYLIIHAYVQQRTPPTVPQLNVSSTTP
jgi:hypothetical protein